MNGFNIQAKRRIEGKTKQAARYMARYVRHPAIADSRIINYDRENVTFVYDREGKTFTVVMDKYESIHNVIKHIPDKHFKVVRYFGIHAIYLYVGTPDLFYNLRVIILYYRLLLLD